MKKNPKEKSEIAKRLRLARVNAGYRHASNFSDSIGVHHITYHQHESGKNGLSNKVLEKYAKALDVSVSWLFSGKEEPEKPPTNEISDVNLLLYISKEIDRLSRMTGIHVTVEEKILLSANIYNDVKKIKKKSDSNILKITLDHIEAIGMKKKQHEAS